MSVALGPEPTRRRGLRPPHAGGLRPFAPGDEGKEPPFRLFEVEEATAVPLAPTRLRARHVVAGVGFLFAAACASVVSGPANLPPLAVLEELASKLPFVHLHSALSSTGKIVVWQLRLPRIVLGGLVGAMLALAGAAYQGVFSNPLADPYLLGVASGAGLGATIAVVEGPRLGHLPVNPLPLAAFAGAIVAVAATFALGRSRTSPRTPATLLLGGVAVAAFFTAIQTFLQQQNTPDLQVVYSWILGGLATAGWGQVRLILPYVAVAALVLICSRGLLDVLSVGDE